MSLQAFPDDLTNRRRTSLRSFYMAALVSATAISVVGWSPSFHKQVLSVAVAGAAAAIWFLLRFLHSNDERERQISYRALTFAFTGTLIFSLAIGFLQSFGFHSISWLGIPVLMVILWSLGLILYSWRYR
jgi:hypothetical protein